MTCQAEIITQWQLIGGEMSKLVFQGQPWRRRGSRMCLKQIALASVRATRSAAPSVTANQPEGKAFTSRWPPNVKCPAVVTVTDEAATIITHSHTHTHRKSQRETYSDGKFQREKSESGKFTPSRTVIGEFLLYLTKTSSFINIVVFWQLCLHVHVLKRRSDRCSALFFWKTRVRWQDMRPNHSGGLLNNIVHEYCMNKNLAKQELSGLF